MVAPLVTGIGCICALGTDVERFWAALTGGSGGIRKIEGFSTAGLRNDLAGWVALTGDLRRFAEERGITSRIELFGAWAIEEALRRAGLDRPALASRRAALVLGTSLGMSLARPDLDASLPESTDPADIIDALPEFAARFGARLGLAETTFMVSTACASGTHAIALGRDLIRHGGFDLVIAGGADTLDRMKYLGHTALSTLTPTLPRPCTAARDGTLFGEGAGIVVLEAPDRLAGRRPLARCLGAGYSTDINHVTAPDPEGKGAVLAMADALRDAGLAPDDIDHINMHGSGTSLNDTAETLGMAQVFGAERAAALPCTTLKPAIGHTMGAAGAIEAVATILSVRDGLIPPTLNIAKGDVALPVTMVCGTAERRPVRCAMSNSFGFGGANGSLIFGL